MYFGRCFNPIDTGELLWEAARELFGHLMQQVGVINMLNEIEIARFDQAVVLHVDVLVAHAFCVLTSPSFDFYTEIDLLKYRLGRLGQLKAWENKPKIAASQLLRLFEELAQLSLYSLSCAGSIVGLLLKGKLDVPVVAEFSQFGQRQEGRSADRLEFLSHQTFDAFEWCQLWAKNVRLQLPDRLRMFHIQKIRTFIFPSVTQRAEPETIDRQRTTGIPAMYG